MHEFELASSAAHPLAPPVSMLYIVIVFSLHMCAHMVNIEFGGSGGQQINVANMNLCCELVSFNRLKHSSSPWLPSSSVFVAVVVFVILVGVSPTTATQCCRGREEVVFSISGRRLWDAPSLRRACYKNNDSGLLAVPGALDGAPASTGRVERMLDVRFRVGGSGRLRP